MLVLMKLELVRPPVELGRMHDARAWKNLIVSAPNCEKWYK